MTQPGTPAAAAPATVTIEPASDGNLDAVQSIYAHHVLTGLASFEETPPDLAEITQRRVDLLNLGLPYLVARVDSVVKGFAYAAPYRHRTAYRHTIEDSIYVDPDATGIGIGKRLLQALIERCTELGYRQMIAVIGDSGNAGSIAVHEKMGFQEVGMLPSVGYKFDRWVDSVIMQRALGLGDGSSPE